MAIINNLTNLFTTSFSGAAQKPNINFKGAESVNTFGYKKLEPYADKFSSNPFGANFSNKAQIEQLAKSSPRIMALLKEYKLPLRVNMDVLEEMR